MTAQKSIDQRLENLEARVSKIESLLSPQAKPKSQTSKPITLSDHILTLRDKAFFAQPQTAGDVHAKLSEKYSCVVNRVAVALVRLSKTKQLRKASKSIDGKSYQAYVW
jgi:hypothetical protein